MLFITFGEQNHFRYRPPKQPQHDLALIKVKKPIIFSSKIMPICLPPSDKFPDEKGVVYAAGWGQKETKEKDCTTGDKGPDPFSRCKFPFFLGDAGLSMSFNQCLLSKSPSHNNKGCKDLYELMKKRKGNTTSFLDKNYGRVNTDTTSRRASGHVDVGTCPHQVMAATLTLSQLGGQIMPTLYTGVHTKS